MLPGFSETCKKILLDVWIIRRLGEPNLIPCLRSSPAASLAMVEGLLIQRNVLQDCRNPFKAVGIVDIGVNILQRLQHPVPPFMCEMLPSAFDMRFQEKQSSSIFIAIDCSL